MGTMRKLDGEGAKVRRVKYIGKQDTYNMEVEGHHNFSINGGLIVHNSGYGLVSYHMSESEHVFKAPATTLPWALRTDDDYTKAHTGDPYGTW